MGNDIFMKTTGVIRRIDDLGRIVIPKEIRKTMRIKNGESLEIYLDEDSIILKKYSPIESLETIASKYVETFNRVLKHNVIVTDKDRVIAIAGNLKKKPAPLIFTTNTCHMITSFIFFCIYFTSRTSFNSFSFCPIH